MPQPQSPQAAPCSAGSAPANFYQAQETLCRKIMQDEQNLKRYIKGEQFIKRSLQQYVQSERYRYLCVPKIFTLQDELIFQTICTTMSTILNKVIQRYETDQQYRRLFGFEPVLEELILAPCPYEECIPISRFDIFFDEKTKDFHFCELNADGASGMGEEDIIAKVIATFPQIAAFSLKHNAKSFDVYGNVTETLLHIYNATEHPKAHPFFVITDFSESATHSEFDVFAKRLKQKGCRSAVCDVRDISVNEEGYMTLNGEVIDAVYRRAVTGELMEKKEQAKGFLEGMKQAKTVVIGHARTQILHTKLIFYVLYHPLTRSMLTAQEEAFIRAHVPETVILQKGTPLYEEACTHKDDFIIKPFDAYASKGVAAGRDATQENWTALLEEKAQENYILQRFITPFVTPNVLVKHHKLETFRFFNLTGLYCLEGKFSGIFSRAGEYNIVSDATGGFSLASIIAKP